MPARLAIRLRRRKPPHYLPESLTISSAAVQRSGEMRSVAAFDPDIPLICTVRVPAARPHSMTVTRSPIIHERVRSTPNASRASLRKYGEGLRQIHGPVKAG